MIRIRLATTGALGILMASPALASGGAPVPHPADFALFGAGVIGLIIGRRSSRSRRR